MKKTLIFLFLVLQSFNYAQDIEIEDVEIEKKSRKEIRKERKLAKASKKAIYALDFPKGIYFSLDELKSKDPKKTNKLVVQERNSGSIKRQGGNDYKLYDSNFTFSHKDVEKRVFAYSNGTELFMNGMHFNLQHSYFKILSDGKYLVFKACLPTKAKKESVQMQIASAKAPVGGKLSGPYLAVMRFVYIMNKETGKITVVDKRNIGTILADAPQLIERFNGEDQKSSTATILKYVIEYNTLAEEDKTATDDN